MVKKRQRRRMLARAKWERQRAKRTASQERARKIGIALGVIVALAAAGGLVWLILHLSDDSEPAPTTPTTPTTSVPATDTLDPSTPTTPSESGGGQSDQGSP